MPTTPSQPLTRCRLVPVHRLRAYDAVILATALAVRSLEPDIGLLPWDQQLREAASREGLRVAP